MDGLLWKIKTFDELTANEVYSILAIRQEVFIVEQTCYYQDADYYDDKALHLWAELDGKIVAYCRLFSQGIKYPECSIGRVLTSPFFRKNSIGKKLIFLALECISTRFKSNKIRISAQDYLIRFYENFGFITTQNSYLEDDIPHTEMYKG